MDITPNVSTDEQSQFRQNLSIQAIIRGLSDGVWNNRRIAKTANYTAAVSDNGGTFALGGGTFFALTYGAVGGYPASYISVLTNEDTVRAKSVVVTGLETFTLYPLQSAIVYASGGAWKTIRPQRWVLTGDVNIYVDGTNGSDSTGDGLASGSGAFATISKALSICYGSIDFATHRVTVNVAAGTYDAHIVLGTFIGYTVQVGYGQLTVQATDPTPSNTKLKDSSQGIAIFASGNTPCTFKGFQFTGCSVAAVEADSGGVVALDGCDFAAIAGNHVISLYSGSRVIFVNSNYTISGGAGVHWQAQFDGQIFIQPGHTCTISSKTATVTFTAANDQITWTSHGLNANDPVYFTTTGSLPTGSPVNMAPTTMYYVKTVVDANNFTISTTPGGATLDLTSAGSGTNTGWNVPSFFFFVQAKDGGLTNLTSTSYASSAPWAAASCSRFQNPTGGGIKSDQKNATVTFTAANDQVTWTSHGLISQEQVYFINSGGALPTRVGGSGSLVAFQTYYVLNIIDQNNFTISDTPGGAQIDLTSAGSGANSGWGPFSIIPGSSAGTTTSPGFYDNV